MTVNTDILEFYSGYPIDKIALQGSATYTLAGPANASVANSFALQSIPNTYGQKGFVAVSWSTDGANFHSQDIPTYYDDTFFGNPAAISFQALGGSDASKIYFFLQNGLTDAGGNPISQTVIINYALYSLT